MLERESTVGTAPGAQLVRWIGNVMGRRAGCLRQITEGLLHDGCKNVVQVREVQVDGGSAHANLTRQSTQRQLARATCLDPLHRGGQELLAQTIALAARIYSADRNAAHRLAAPGMAAGRGLTCGLRVRLVP